MRYYYFQRFFHPEDGGAAPGAGQQPQETEADRKLRAAQERTQKAEAEARALKEREETLKREKEESDLKAKGEYEKLVQLARDREAQRDREHNERLIELELARLSAKTGLRKEEYVRLMDRSGVVVKDGRVEGAEAAFQKFQKEFPDLFGTQQKGGVGSTHLPPTSPETSSVVEEQLKRLNEWRKPRLPRNWKD